MLWGGLRAPALTPSPKPPAPIPYKEKGGKIEGRAGTINPAGTGNGKLVTTTKIEAGKFLVQCRECGRWQEVTPKHLRCDGYFEEWQADFRCCDRQQTAVFTLEKDYLDFH
jgi:hypothetical protein